MRTAHRLQALTRPASPAALRWPAALALTAVLAAATVLFDAPHPLRALAVLAFLGAAPGLSLIGLLGIGDLTQRLVLGIGLSLALDTIVAGLCLYAGVWSPTGILLILVALTLVGAGLHLRVVTERHDPIPPPAMAGDSPRTGTGNETTRRGMDRIAPLVSASSEQATTPGPITAPVQTGQANGQHHRRAPGAPGNPTPAARATRTVVLLSVLGGSIILIAMNTRRAPDVMSRLASKCGLQQDGPYHRRGGRGMARTRSRRCS